VAPARCWSAAAKRFWSGSRIFTIVIDRLNAYAEAGADCLYAPGIRAKEQIATLVKAMHPKPVNILVGSPGLSVAELAELWRPPHQRRRFRWRVQPGAASCGRRGRFPRRARHELEPAIRAVS